MSRRLPTAELEPSGLTTEEAGRRLAEVGANEIQRAQRTSRWRLLARQLASPLIWLLFGAAVVSGFLGEVADAVAITTIVVLNALVGYFQEGRAENALLALRSLTAPRATVIRDGHRVEIAAATVVPGDLLVLEAGDVVAADARLIEAHLLSTNEAALTGESAPVEKRTTPVAADAPLAERFDCAFMGTSVAAGAARAEVLATGMKTELGRIAHLLADATDTTTPLQTRLARVSRTLLILCLGIVAVIAVLGFVRGRPPLEVFISAVSLAVAAVPEGLPAIVTIALAIGVQRMAARHVLIRRLPAVETLGSATVICTDKTGTLTTGVMTVRELWGPNHHELLAAAAACCDAELGEGGRTGTGDPTELALLGAAAERGIDRHAIEKEHPRRHVNPFDADRKRMSIGRSDGVLYVKGAPELLFPLCTSGAAGAAEANIDMAARGLRVLGVAVGSGVEEKDLRLLGVVGIADPPRSEAIAAVAAAREAGVHTVMITGDQAVTAGAIARELGIVRAGEDAADRVHARATPEDKLRIVRDWKARGAIVAMTGDGVNDAPALREAHIGIAMGRSGTEVTREASDMVLADDNFASIVAAVREGRGIFDNIRKTLVYLLAGNTAELLVMLVFGCRRPAVAVAAAAPALDQPGDGRAARAGAGHGPGRRRHPAPSAAPAGGAAAGPPRVDGASSSRDWSKPASPWACSSGPCATGISARHATSRSTPSSSASCSAPSPRAVPTSCSGRWASSTTSASSRWSPCPRSIQIGIHQIPAAARLFRIQDLPLETRVLPFLLALIPVTVLELRKLLRRPA